MSKLSDDLTETIQQTELLLEPGKITSIVRNSEEYRNDLNIIASGQKAKVYRQTQDPSNDSSIILYEGDFWVVPSADEDYKEESFVWDGSEWVPLVDTEYITELGSRIEQTNESIEATVKKKLEGYATTTELQAAIQESADNISLSVNESLTDYATKDSLTVYATKDNLSDYATVESMSDYASKDSLSDYATKDSLANYATKKEVTAAIDVKAGEINSSVESKIEQATGENSSIVRRQNTAEEKITPESIVDTVTSSNEFTTQYATREQTATAISQAVSEVDGNVSKLEQTVDGISATVSEVDGNVSELEQTVNGISASVSTNTGAIANLQLSDSNIISSVQDANDNITKLEQDANAQQTQVQNNQGNIATLTAKSDTIDARVSTNEEDIGQQKQTSESFETKISNAEGNISRLEQDAEQFKISVEHDITAMTSDATGQQMTLSFDRGGSVEVEAETLTCYVHVWKNGEEVTDQIPKGAFSWQRSSTDSASDTAWNANHKSTKVITLTRDEIGKSCQIKCTQNAKGYYGYFDIQDGYLLIIRPDDGCSDEFSLQDDDLYGDESYEMDEDGYVYKNGVPGQMSVTSTVFDHTVLETSHILIKDNKVEIHSGGDIAVQAGGSLSLASGADINVASGGHINVQSGGNIDIASGGTFSIVSNNFTVTNEGKVTVKGEIESESGSIGGWEINPGNLQSGSGTSHVELSTADPTYAIWAGKEDPDQAPFRVTKDGKVYLVRVMALANENDTTASEVNLSGLPLWKLNRSIVSGITQTENGFSFTTLGGSGGTITFKKAVGVGTNGSGSVFPVDANGNNIGTTSISVSSDSSSGRLGGWTNPSSVLVFFNIVLGSGTVIRSNDFVTVDASDIYDKGAESVTVTSITRNAADYYVGGDNHSTNVYAKATASNGAFLNSTLTVDGSTAYKAGWNDFYNSCSLDDSVYTITNPNRTIYVYENGSYIPTTGFYSVTRANGRYTIPPKK